MPALLLSRGAEAGLPRLDRDRGLHRIRPGVFTSRDEWSRLRGWERYRLRVLAVAETWQRPIFAFESAAVVHGMPIFGEPRFVHLLSHDGGSWRQGDVITHGWSDPPSIAEVGGLWATSMEATAVDLGRVLPLAFGLGVADATARALGPATRLAVADLGRAGAPRRGLRRLDWIQARMNARSESVGESVSRAVIEWLGYPPPHLQAEFAFEGFRDRADFHWPNEHVLGESDGYGKYDAADAEASKRHFILEKRREDRLRRNVGPMARWDWADTMRVEPLDLALRAAGLSPVRPRDRAMLASVSTNPRSL